MLDGNVIDIELADFRDVGAPKKPNRWGPEPVWIVRRPLPERHRFKDVIEIVLGERPAGVLIDIKNSTP